MASDEFLSLGTVYCLASKSEYYTERYEVCYKIGSTARPIENRLKEINQSVKSDIICVYKTETIALYKSLEQLLHACLKDYRVRSKYNKSLTEWYCLDTNTFLKVCTFLDKPNFYNFTLLLNEIYDLYYDRATKNIEQDYLEALQTLEITCKKQSKLLISATVKSCVDQFIVKPTVLDYSLAISYLAHKIKAIPMSDLNYWGKDILFPDF